jgi:4-hydroxybenzoate polyprenyltransferase
MPAVLRLDRRQAAAPVTRAVAPAAEWSYGTAGDAVAEEVLRLVRRNPLYLVPLAIWMFGGRWFGIPAGRGGSLANLARAVGFRFAMPVGASGSSLYQVAAAIRIHHWLKNLLLLVPLLAGHAWGDGRKVFATLAGVVAFNLLGSAACVWNDLMDLDADRAHPIKRTRPFAAGLLGVRLGLAMAAVLTVYGGVASLLVGPGFGALAAAYFAVTLAYSLWLRRLIMIDVLVLAGLYTGRVIAGAVAASVALSPWLVAMTMFFFLSVVLAGRCAQLRGEASPASCYRKTDYGQLARLGSASAFVTVLIVALYIQQASAARMVAHPQWLWGVAAALLYWLSRLWLLTDRGELDEDPVLFALRDRASRASGIVAVVSVMAALGAF